MNSKLVCFSYRNGLDDDPFISQKAELFRLLRTKYDLEPMVSVGGKNAVHGDVIAVSPVDAHGIPQLASLRTVPVTHFAAYINRSRGVIPLVAPMLNNRSTLRYASSKMITHQELFIPHGIGIKTFELHSPDAVREAFSAVSAKRVVLKKVNGTLTEGLFIEERQEARRILEKELLPAGVRYVMQPAYDFTIEWPHDLRPYSKADLIALQAYGHTSRPKELRMYFFYKRDTATGEVSVECFPVARTSLESTTYMKLPTTWFCIDPASLPPFIAQKTADVARSLGAQTDATATFGCLDWGYGTIDDEEPAWVCIEGNFRAPYLLSSDKHPVVGPLLYDKFANLVSHTALGL